MFVLAYYHASAQLILVRVYMFSLAVLRYALYCTVLYVHCTFIPGARGDRYDQLYTYIISKNRSVTFI